MDRLRKLALLSTAVAAFGGSAGAAAQGGSMSYGPLAVPALGGTALVVLAALLALFALRYAKLNQSGSRMLTIALAVTALSSAGGGVHFINKAYAGGATPLDQVAGATVPLSVGPNQFENVTSVRLRINTVSPGPGCTAAPALNGGGTTCASGVELKPTEMCSVMVSCGGLF